MIDLIATRPRALDQQGELLLHPLLTDELAERARPECVVEVAVLGQHDLGVDQPLVAHRPARCSAVRRSSSTG